MTIVNYRTSREVERLLRSLARQAVRCEVTVVDNCSPDGDGERLRSVVERLEGEGQSPSGVRVLLSDKNLGYGVGCNLGLEGTAAPYCCVLNPDTQLPEGAMRAWLLALQREERQAAKLHLAPIGLLAPLLLNDNGTPQRSTYQFQNFANYWLYHSLLAGGLKTLRKRMRLPGGGVVGRAGGAAGAETGSEAGTSDAAAAGAAASKPATAREVDWVMGAAYLIPRPAWQAVGGFDDAYFLYAEDTDLCWRLKRDGYRVLYDPRVAIVHTQGEPSPERRAASLVRLFKGLRLFVTRNYGPARRTGLELAVILDMMMRVVIFGLLHLLRPRDTMTHSRLTGARQVLRLYLSRD